MKKFKIPTTPITINKCVRFPVNLVEQIEEKIRGKECTFTAFVLESVRVALENIKE